MRFLIILLLVLSALIGKLVFSQTYSDIIYSSGTIIDVGTGADVCATNILINGTFSGGGTICSGALPVELLSFTFTVNKNNVAIAWETAFEINNSGFDIERAQIIIGTSVTWQKAGSIQGNGTTNEPKHYVYFDKKLKTGKYKYRLKQIDYNGSHEYFDLAGDVIVEPPRNFAISQNYPNPSNPKSKIDFEIPMEGKVKIKLYNILGEEVYQILDEVKQAGYYTAEFDGSNLASGVYFYRITADGNGINFSRTLKMILVK